MLVPFFRTLKHIFPYFKSPNNKCRSNFGATAQHSVSARHFPPFHSTNHSSSSTATPSTNPPSNPKSPSSHEQPLLDVSPLNVCANISHQVHSHKVHALTLLIAFIILSDAWRWVPCFLTLASMCCKWYGAFSATPHHSTIGSPLV